MSSLAFLPLALSLLACRAPASAGDTSEAAASDAALDPRFQELLAWTEASMLSWQVPGMAVGVFADGRALRAGLGLRRLDAPDAVTPATLFRVGSISKLLTGMALVQEAEAGRLDLDAPADQALEGVALAAPHALSQVSLLQLMTHQAGLQVPGLPNACDTAPEVYEQELSDRTPAWALWTEPGLLFNYASTGVALVGLAIERSSGDWFADRVAEGILGPADMATATFDPAVAEAREHATGHSLDPATGEVLAWRDMYDRACTATQASGGLIASLDDMLALAAVLLQGGTPVVSPAAWRRMTTTGWGDADSSLYGHGLQVGSYREHPALSHTGSLHGFQAILYVLPEDGLAVVVLVNSDHGVTLVPEPWYKPTHRVAERALDLFLGLEPQERLSTVRDPSEWGRYPGRYHSAYDWGTVEVTQGEDGLLLAEDSGEVHTLLPYSRDRFQYETPCSDGRTCYQQVEFLEEEGTEQTRWLVSSLGVADRL